ncbi:MAG: TIGR00162 family protein [uncultured archaeon A07HB70]|jgi:TIGR00162 family protein|nr:MAG: TIGR00162 family protein [uncultured archaeon A07HB70]
MDPIEIDRVADPSLDDPVLVEGLPGVGHVGKLAADHLTSEFDSALVRRVYADDFPPQVAVEDGVASLACAEFHAVDADGVDLLVLTGDHQAGSTAGHYRLTDAFLDVAESFGVGRAYALGGLPTGELMDDDDHAVVGAVTDAEMCDDLTAAGVEFRDSEPAGGIVGVSGLLLGLGSRRGLAAACLMGETSGYLVDPKSARAVITALEDLLGFSVALEDLEERAEEMEEVAGRIREMQEANAPVPDDDLRYIG